MDLNVFPLLVEKQYREDGISASQLAEFTRAEKDLIGMYIFMFMSISMNQSPPSGCPC